VRAIFVTIAILSRGASASPEKYSAVTLERVQPSFALSSGSDNTNSAKVSVPWIWDVAPDLVAGADVTSYTIAPTAGLTDSSKTSLVSLGGASGPDFGGTIVSLGVLGAYTQQSPINFAEEYLALGKMHDAVTKVARTKCPEIKTPEAIDQSELCEEGKKALKKLDDVAIKRARFPAFEASAWLGGSISQFKYYETIDTSPPMFSSATVWKPSGAAAAQLTAVPWSDDEPLGLTFELPVIVNEAYQASKKNGTACTMQGATPDGSTLSSCTASEPIGAPKFGALVTVKALVGVVDQEHAYWRAAVGAGYSHNFVDSSDTWSIEVPMYVNATAMGGSKESKGKSNAPIAVQYDGIVRITASFQHSTSTTSPGWSALLNFDLLGQRNLFTRADALAK
jgi:hypothetical protein